MSAAGGEESHSLFNESSLNLIKDTTARPVWLESQAPECSAMPQSVGSAGCSLSGSVIPV